MVAALTPWLVNIIYNAGLSPEPGLELTPLVLIFTGTIFVWSTVRLHMLDLAPVARETLIETMAEGMVVLDVRDRVVDFNPAAQRLLAPPVPLAPGQVASTIFGKWSAWAAPVDEVSETSVELPIDDDTVRYLELYISPVCDPRPSFRTADRDS
ncbi:MAG: PAS domain-containing protein [Anaerolineales bacterium]|nr:PAS domain-containing protein [Anaerolineales bacterium]